jgi:hypothetical protein
MPALQRPAELQTVVLPSRLAAVAAETDVLVVGGGPAGLGAALGAAEAGAQVILVERYGFLGGNATAALTVPMATYFTERTKPVEGAAAILMPGDHGPGEPVTAGVLKRLVERLVASGGAIPPSDQTGYVVPFDPEVLKLVAVDLLDEAGVQLLLHSFASGVVAGSNGPSGVVFETKSGPIVVKAKVIIDCTGDGDVAAYSGAAFEIGRSIDDLVQPMTLLFLLAGFEPQAFKAYSRAHPGQWRGVHGLWDLIRKAEAEGELDLPREDVLLFGTPHPDEVAVNSTRVTGVRGADVWDLTYAEWLSRRQMRQIVAFLRRYVPGFEKTYIAQSGFQVGIRETRRITGEYRLTREDVLTARKFADVIARGTYPIDIHNPSGKGTTLERLPPGEAYDVPLRTLLPLQVDHLLVAGRCLSGTHEAQSSYRVTPIAVATGQAAGVAAALAVRTGRLPREVPASDVQEELERQGADLGSRTTSRLP